MISFVTLHNIQNASCIMPIYRRMKELGYDVEQTKTKPNNDKIVTGVKVTRGMDKAIYYQHGLGIHEKGTNPKSALAYLYPGNFWVVGEKKHKVVGWTKSDYLFSPDLEEKTEKVKEEIKFNHLYDKTILFATTEWRKYLLKDWLVKLVAGTKYFGINLIVKPYVKHQEFYSVVKNSMQDHHVTYVDPDYPDITHLFPFTDVVFSNGSSVLWEFLITGKPSVNLLQKGSRHAHPFGVKHIETGIASTLIDFLYNKRFGEEELKVWKDREVIYKPDGKATDRAIQYILKVFDEA